MLLPNVTKYVQARPGSQMVLNLDGILQKLGTKGPVAVIFGGKRYVLSHEKVAAALESLCAED